VSIAAFRAGYRPAAIPAMASEPIAHLDMLLPPAVRQAPEQAYTQEFYDGMVAEVGWRIQARIEQMSWRHVPQRLQHRLLHARMFALELHQQALRPLTLQAQIAKLTERNDVLKEDLNNASLAARTIGAERDEAQFRTLELEEKLQSISSVMGKALGLVVPPQDKPAEPEVERTPEPSHVDEMKGTTISMPASGDADHTYEVAWRLALVREEAYRHTYAEAPEVVSPSNPFETSDGYTPVPPATSTSEEPSAQPIADTAALPFAGREWKSKPPQMTWKEFVSLGGERPYWMTEHEASYASYT